MNIGLSSDSSSSSVSSSESDCSSTESEEFHHEQRLHAPDEAVAGEHSSITGDQITKPEHSVVESAEAPFCSASALGVFNAISDNTNSSCGPDDDGVLLDEVLKNFNTDPVFPDVVSAASTSADEDLANFAVSSGALTSSTSALQRSLASAPASTFHTLSTAAAVSVSTYPQQHHGQTVAVTSYLQPPATQGFPTQSGVNQAANASSMRVVFNTSYDYNVCDGAFSNNQQPFAHGGGGQLLQHGSTAIAPGMSAAQTTNPLALNTTLLSQQWDPDAANPIDFNSMHLQLPNVPAAGSMHNSAHHLYTHDIKPSVGALHGSSAMEFLGHGNSVSGEVPTANLAQYLPHNTRHATNMAGGMPDHYRHGDSNAAASRSNSYSHIQLPKNIRLPQRRGAVQLWQFLLSLLDERKGDPSLVEWTDNSKLEFRLLNPEGVAVKWGEEKHRPSMNYDKLSRSLRYYYDKGIMQKVSGERYVYKFTCPPELLYRALGERDTGVKPVPRVPVRRSSSFGPAATMPQFSGSLVHSHSDTAIAGVSATYETHAMPADQLMFSAASASLLSPLQSDDSKSMLHPFGTFPYVNQAASAYGSLPSKHFPAAGKP